MKAGSAGLTYETLFFLLMPATVFTSAGRCQVTKKVQLAPIDSDSGPSDAEDEQPQIVVLRQGDLTAEEAAKIKRIAENSEKSEKLQPEDGKIVFRKPSKRSSEDKVTGVFTTSSKKKKEDHRERAEFKSLENKAKQIKNSSLLSFGDDDDE